MSSSNEELGSQAERVKQWLWDIGRQAVQQCALWVDENKGVNPTKSLEASHFQVSACRGKPRQARQRLRLDPGKAAASSPGGDPCPKLVQWFHCILLRANVPVQVVRWHKAPLKRNYPEYCKLSNSQLLNMARKLWSFSNWLTKPQRRYWALLLSQWGKKGIEVKAAPIQH